MVNARFQNKVAGSVFTLPICIVIAVALWWLPQRAFSVPHILGLVLCLLTTYVVMETNAQQHIIRIRTRMMSCVWLMLTACLAFMHPLGEPIIAAACLCISYMLLFRCYQRLRPQAFVFHAFLMLSIGSFFAPVMLAMAIPFFLYIALLLRSLTKKAFWAGILGLIAPYWCYAFWYFITGKIDPSKITLPIGRIPFLDYPFDYQVLLRYIKTEELLSLPFSVQVSAAFIILLSIVSIVHYMRTNYDDKIRVRMILYIYMTQTLLLMVFLVLQPAHYETTMALLVASASPLIAHYFSLTGSILSNSFFVLSLLLTAGMATLNLWLTSFSIY